MRSFQWTIKLFLTGDSRNVLSAYKVSRTCYNSNLNANQVVPINQHLFQLEFYVLTCHYVLLKRACDQLVIFLSFSQEDANRGKPNWEHLADDLHVLITVEDSENRAKVKLQRAVEEVQKLLVPVS